MPLPPRVSPPAPLPTAPHPSPATQGPAREPTLAADPGSRPLSLGFRPFGQRLLLAVPTKLCERQSCPDLSVYLKGERKGDSLALEGLHIRLLEEKGVFDDHHPSCLTQPQQQAAQWSLEVAARGLVHWVWGMARAALGTELAIGPPPHPPSG